MQSTKQFFLLASAVGFLSDLVLRDWDHPRFRQYFASRGVVEAAIIGGAIVLFVVTLAALAVSPRDRMKYLVAVTIASYVAAVLHDAIEPFGPELRSHSQRDDARLLDTLVGPFVALVVYGMQDFILPRLS